MEWNEKEAQSTLAEVIKRSTVDPEYRALLLSDANAAIAQVNPVPLPEQFRIRFVANDNANLTIVLPDALAEDGTLSDAELEQVAGGGGRGGGGCEVSNCLCSCAISSVL